MTDFPIIQSLRCCYVSERSPLLGSQELYHNSVGIHDGEMRLAPLILLVALSKGEVRCRFIYVCKRGIPMTSE